jgi:hypothetical protein
MNIFISKNLTLKHKNQVNFLSFLCILKYKYFIIIYIFLLILNFYNFLLYSNEAY